MPKGDSLFKVVNGLRYFGVGCKLTRSIHKLPNTYFLITDVKLSKDQNHGKAYGQLVWNGRPQAGTVEIGAPLKKEWSLLETPDYSKFKGKSQISEMLQ
jgi:hypothetical protein